MTPLWLRGCAFPAVSVFFLFTAIGMRAETCQTTSDMDETTRAALSAAGQRYFDMVVKGDASALRQNAVPSVASDFSAIESTVKEYQQALAGSAGVARPAFLLDAEGTTTIAKAEFYCGVFGKSGQTARSAVFSLNDLPPGKYGIVILDADSAKIPMTVSLVLQQIGTDWKLGGLYIKATQIAGHDSGWFLSHAREYKAKGQLHNASLYYLEAYSLISPLPFMSTAATDKLYDESHGLQPTDFPVGGKPVELAAGGATYKLTELYPEAFGNDLNLTVKYQASDISNTNQTYQNSVALINMVFGCLA